MSNWAQFGNQLMVIGQDATPETCVRGGVTNVHTISEQLPKLLIKPGINVWRVMMSRELGQDRKAILESMGFYMNKLLTPAQGNSNWYRNYGVGQTEYVWTVGQAIRVQAIEANFGAADTPIDQFGQPAAMGVPAGPVLGSRYYTDTGDSREGNVISAAVSVVGCEPHWWVYIMFWWNGPEKQIDIPAYPLNHIQATVDVAVHPNAQYKVPGQTEWESWEEWFSDAWQITEHDTKEAIGREDDQPLIPWWVWPTGLAALVAGGWYYMNRNVIRVKT